MNLVVGTSDEKSELLRSKNFYSRRNLCKAITIFVLRSVSQYPILACRRYYTYIVLRTHTQGETISQCSKVEQNPLGTHAFDLKLHSLSSLIKVSRAIIKRILYGKNEKLPVMIWNMIYIKCFLNFGQWGEEIFSFLIKDAHPSLSLQY